MPQDALAPSQPTPRTIDLIVVHCSATRSGARITPPGQPGVTPTQVIDAWHADRGFARDPAAVLAYNPHLPHIGYHFVIDLDGQVYTGRRLREVGAHVAGHNRRSVGVCLVGGAEPVARYTSAQWTGLQTLVHSLRAMLPGATVTGHRELSPDANGDGLITHGEWLKTCPGFDVPAWVAAGFAPPAGQVLPVPGDPADAFAAPTLQA